MSIFFDMSKNGEVKKDVFEPQDLTDHYLKEFESMFLDKVYIATHYGDIRHTIELYKYRSDRQYVWEYVDLLARTIDKYWIHWNKKDITLVGVPMHWSRYLIRWFDHIDILVSGLSQKFGLPIKKPIQAFFTRRQSKLSKMYRMKNREHVFWLKKWQIFPKTVVLVDDIISTGSTANACAKLLKSAWVENVYWVFIASNQ